MNEIEAKEYLKNQGINKEKDRKEIFDLVGGCIIDLKSVADRIEDKDIIKGSFMLKNKIKV
jgi:hypothetical protein